jgi:hypothetical protein
MKPLIYASLCLALFANPLNASVSIAKNAEPHGTKVKVGVAYFGHTEAQRRQTQDLYSLLYSIRQAHHYNSNNQVMPVVPSGGSIWHHHRHHH